MNGLCEIRRVAAHFDRQSQLAHEVAGVRADDPSSHDALGRFVDQKLGHSFVSTRRNASTRRLPRKKQLANSLTSLLRALDRNSDPGDFWVGIGDLRDD